MIRANGRIDSFRPSQWSRCYAGLHQPDFRHNRTSRESPAGSSPSHRRTGTAVAGVSRPSHAIQMASVRDDGSPRRMKLPDVAVPLLAPIDQIDPFAVRWPKISVRQVADWEIVRDPRRHVRVAMRINVRDDNLRDRIAHIDIVRRSNLNRANVANDARLRFPSVFKSEIVEILSLPPVHDAISL